MKFLEIITKLFKKEEQKKEIKHLGKIFEEIEIGDIVFAKRNGYGTHPEGPYLIMDKVNDKLYGFYATSKEKNTDDYHWCKINYNNDKNTYINLNNLELIEKERFLHYITSLNKDKLNYIKKNLLLNKNNKYKSKNFNKIEYEHGDIVFYKGKCYYIYNKVDSEFIMYEIHLSLSNEHNLTIRDKNYNVNYKNVLKVNEIESENFELLAVNERKTIIDLRNINKEIEEKKHLEEISIKKNIERGDIVKHKNKLYYIFGEYQNDWMVYELNVGSIYITLNNVNYKTDLIDQYINKNERLYVVATSKVIEQEYIKRIKKSYLKEQKEIKKESLLFKNIIEGKIIYRENEKYIVVNREENILTCIDVNNNQFIKICLTKNEDWKVLDVIKKQDLYNLRDQLSQYQKCNKLIKVIK